MQTKILQALFLFLFFCSSAFADSPVYSTSVKADFNKVYQHVYKSLENNRLFIVLEPNIGSNLSGFAKRWGDNYNRNKLDNFRSMVFCNAWYANEMSNKDIAMTSICPLHITLTHRKGITSVHFVRPDFIAKASKASSVASELTELVIKAITEGINASQK